MAVKTFGAVLGSIGRVDERTRGGADATSVANAFVARTLRAFCTNHSFFFVREIALGTKVAFFSRGLILFARDAGKTRGLSSLAVSSRATLEAFGKFRVV